MYKRIIFRLFGIVLVIVMAFNIKFANAQFTAPEIISVSLDSLNQPVITWKEHTNPAVQGYYVYIELGALNQRIGEVIGRTVTTFTYTNSNADTRVESFKVLATDLIGGTDEGNFSEKHNSILLEVDIDECTGNISLNWNAYINFEGGLDEYDVFIIEEGQASIKFTSVSNTTTNFSTSNLKNSTNYQFYIEAISNDGVRARSSNTLTLVAYQDLPSWVYISAADVISESEVEIRWKVPLTGEITYEIYVKENNNQFTLYEPVVLPYQTIMKHIISGLNTNQHNYTFRINAKNECDNVTTESENTPKTILLKHLNQDKLFDREFAWNTYPYFFGGLKSYDIYKGNPTNFKFIESKNNLLFYTERSELSRTNCYYIYAEEAATNLRGVKDSVKSNVICFNDEDIDIKINAFTPNGVNPIFFPQEEVIAANDVTLQVYSRFGNLVFESKSADEGWDGTSKNGKDSPAGVYVYQLLLTNRYTGDASVKMGNVTLVR